MKNYKGENEKSVAVAVALCEYSFDLSVSGKDQK
jgi:hypothetical protein